MICKHILPKTNTAISSGRKGKKITQANIVEFVYAGRAIHNLVLMYIQINVYFILLINNKNRIKFGKSKRLIFITYKE